MTVTEIADDLQDQLLSLVRIAQDNIVGTLEWASEHATILLPEPALRLADRLPKATAVVERSFDRAEQWLRNQREFSTKLAAVLTPSARDAAAS